MVVKPLIRAHSTATEPEQLVAQLLEQFAVLAGQACEEARHSVLELAESSQAIQSVVRNIGAVASQTRMLALNANIEAARAGDLGRGFAVVASEVKGLANQTQSATEDIQLTIARVQAGSKIALNGTEKVRDSVQNIQTLAKEVRDQPHFQRAATSEINKSLQEASNLSQSLCRQSNEVSQVCNESLRAARAVLEESAQVASQANALARTLPETASQSPQLAMRVFPTLWGRPGFAMETLPVEVRWA